MRSIRRRVLTAAVVCIALLTGEAGATAQLQSIAKNQDGRLRLNIDDGWLFVRQQHGSGKLGSFDRESTEAKGVEPQFRAASVRSYDDASWEHVDLPHTWNAFDVTDAEPGYWRGIGWYRRHFTVDSKFAGKRVSIEFEGVGQEAEVWLNGKRLGEHKGGYTPFAFEITPLYGRDNILTVKVNNLFDATVPPTVKTDYNFYGGIYRSVWLCVTDRSYVAESYWTTPSVSAQAAQVQVHTSVRNEHAGRAVLQLVQELYGPNGALVERTLMPLDVDGGATRVVDQNLSTVPHPALWSPATPNLYRIHTSLQRNGKVIDTTDIPLGFRWFRFDPQRGLIFNGQRIQIQGTNWHQSYPGMGNALPKSRHVEDMEEMHNMGVNFWRTSHYPHDVATMDASDRLGMMVWEELPINKEVGEVSAYTRNVSRMAEEMIARDRNHPSVLVWGIAGEVNAPQEVAKSIVAAVASRYRKLDPTRPVGMHAPRGEAIEELVDVVGAAPGPETDEEHRQHPERAYLDAEYSVALIGRGIYGGGPESEEAGLEHHEAYLSKLHARPWMAGGCIWNQFDYDGETYDPVVPHIVSFGMQDVWRIPKEVYFFYQSQWTAKPMVHIVGNWTKAGQEGKFQTVKVYTNLDEVELSLNGKSLGTKKVIPNGGLDHPPVVWSVPYESGELLAKARGKAGSATDVRKTAGAPYAIRLTGSTRTLVAADRNSLSYIQATVVDEAGVPVPGASPAVTFTSYGPGELLKQSWLGRGVGYTWETVDGTTRIAFRATSRSGNTVISAFSPGLRTGKIDINVTAPGKPDEMNYKELFKVDELNHQE